MSRITELRQEEKELTKITDISWKGAIIAGLLASCCTFLSLWGIQQRNNTAIFAGHFGIAISGAISITGLVGYFRYSFELNEVTAKIEKRQGIPLTCIKCSYFSNNEYLPCAVRPNLEENCRDWEAR